MVEKWKSSVDKGSSFGALLVLFKLNICTTAYSDPDQAFSMELSVDYFLGKLRLGCLAGFLGIPRFYVYTYNLYLMICKHFYFILVYFYLIPFLVDTN